MVIDPRFLALCLEVMDRPWEWGAADCCTAACDVFLELYGIDPMTSLRGRYSTRREALMLIQRRGGWWLMTEGLAREAGLLPGIGAPGEIGLAQTQDSHSLVLCYAPGLWAGKTETGMTTVRAAERSWRAPSA